MLTLVNKFIIIILINTCMYTYKLELSLLRMHVYISLYRP